MKAIALSGLTHFLERTSAEEMESEQRGRNEIDAICDELARELRVPFERIKTVFAAPAAEDDAAGWSRFGDVKLEIKTDPQTTYVYDRELHSNACIAYYKTPGGSKWLEENPQFRAEVEKMWREKITKDFKEYLKEYLQTRVKLADFLDLPQPKKLKRIAKPEIALPSPVNPKFIRVARK